MLNCRNDGQDTEIKMETIQEQVFYKVQQTDDNMKSQLRQMVSSVLPTFQSDSNWPENIKKDFLSQTHRFLARLTEEISSRDGKTKLYIPNEDFEANYSTQDRKDLIQRLEATQIQWQRQIKELLNNQVNQNDSDNAGPIDEILQWSNRKDNLSNIKDQLDCCI